MNCEGKRAHVALVALNMKIVHFSAVLHSSNFAHGRAERPADKILRVVSAVSPQNVPWVYVHDGREERVSLRAAEAKMILWMLPDSPRWCRSHGGMKPRRLSILPICSANLGETVVYRAF